MLLFLVNDEISSTEPPKPTAPEGNQSSGGKKEKKYGFREGMIVLSLVIGTAALFYVFHFPKKVSNILS